MLEMEIAALARFFHPIVERQYFREVPADIAVPSLYFPAPEADGGSHSFNSYRNSFTLYLKVFHKDSFSSYSLASELARKLQEHRRLVPLYDAKGNLTGKDFFVRMIKIKIIDVGVTQVMAAWDSVGAYGQEAVPKASRLYFDGMASAGVKEEEDG